MHDQLHSSLTRWLELLAVDLRFEEAPLPPEVIDDPKWCCSLDLTTVGVGRVCLPGTACGGNGRQNGCGEQ